MRVTRKGQAATEFIMTYGWAILVVLAAIGALAYFGVLSPDKFLPERCNFPAGIDCIDKAVITGADVNATLGLAATIENNGQAAIVITCGTSLPTGRFKSDITVTYLNLETSLEHRATGNIRGRAT